MLLQRLSLSRFVAACAEVLDLEMRLAFIQFMSKIEQVS